MKKFEKCNFIKKVIFVHGNSVNMRKLINNIVAKLMQYLEIIFYLKKNIDISIQHMIR